jgi:hypothetical protein
MYYSLFVKISFLCTETAAFLLVLVYMSKRDERNFNRYCINNVMKNVRNQSDSQIDKVTALTIMFFGSFITFEFNQQ